MLNKYEYCAPLFKVLWINVLLFCCLIKSVWKITYIYYEYSKLVNVVWTIYLLQVSVKFRVVNGTAIEHSDFETISDTAIIPDGASSIDLPIRIIDDNLPELEEIFYVELLNQITGGGVLGAEQYRVAVIHILASDDPEGAFG